MRVAMIVGMIMLAVLPAFSQAPASKWTVGTIMAVNPNQEAGTPDPLNPKYDVSIRVGNTVYVVLYTPRVASNIVEYRVGIDLPVLVGKKTVTFNELGGKPREVPILRKISVPNPPPASK